MIGFFALLFFNWYYGKKLGTKNSDQIDEMVETALEEHTNKITVVPLKNEVREYRCSPKDKRVGVMTVNYTTISRSMATNVLINKVIKGSEKLFIGVKFRDNDKIDVDPAYKFYVVPYRNKSLINKNFEKYVALDDIPSTSPKADSLFMLKSQSSVEVNHFLGDETFVNTLIKMEPYLEVLMLQPAREDTEPHMQMSFKFKEADRPKVKSFVSFFFLTMSLHLQNNDKVKKMVSSQKYKSMASTKRKTKSAKKKKKLS